MTYAQARLIVWNPAAYARQALFAAAAFILGTLDASDEDVAQASGVLDL